jgi:hypothetical protein
MFMQICAAGEKIDQFSESLILVGVFHHRIGGYHRCCPARAFL